MMKNKISIIPVLLAVVIALASCTPTTKNDISEYIKSFSVGAYLREASNFNPATGTFVAAGGLGSTIDFGNIAAGSVGRRVRPWGSPISKVNVYVVRSTNNDQSSWKFVKSYDRNPTDTSFFDIRVSAAEIATALSIPLDTSAFRLGDVFTFYTEVITSDGRKYTINNTNADIVAPGSSYFAVFNFSATVVCPFVPAAMAGNYRVVADDWEDWSPGDVLNNVVAFAAGDSMGIQNVYPNPAFGGNSPRPFVVKVTVGTGAATVTNQLYGRYGGTPYAVTTQGTSNLVLSCIGRITLQLRHHVPNSVNLVYGSAGGYKLELQKL